MAGESLPAPAESGPSWASVVGAIGPKVRALRLERGLTLQQLAQAADVATASVHKVERGDMVPTVTTLLKIASALGAPVRYFVEDDGAVPTGVHTRFAEAVAAGPVLITGPPERFHARGVAVRFGPGEERTSPRRAGETLLVVLAGQVDVAVAADQYVVRAGEALHFPSGMEHRMVNDGDVPADAVVIDVPES